MSKDNYWFYGLKWSDPDDADNATNHAFETFKNIDLLLKCLNYKLETKPNIKVSVYSIFEKIELRKTNVVTKYKLA